MPNGLFRIRGMALRPVIPHKMVEWDGEIYDWSQTEDDVPTTADLINLPPYSQVILRYSPFRWVLSMSGIDTYLKSKT